MNNSTKIFIASLLIFACSIGFFLGSMTCNKMEPPTNEMMMPPPPQMPPFPNGMEPPFNPEKGPFNKGEGFHKEKKMHHESMANIDSILQISPEQKVLMEQHRHVMDSVSGIFIKQKMDAEMDLKSALESDDSAKAEEAKSRILAADSALLEGKIQGFFALSKILSKEQMEKFRDLPKKHFQKGKHFGKEPPKN